MKKVFLSLATIAFVAAGSLTVTSCGGDDSVTPTPPPPPPGLTENFVQIQDTKSELNFTWLGYESNAAVEGADFLEQALNPSDPSKLYVVWRFTTMTEDSEEPESVVINWFATEVDQTQTGNARYKLPFTTGSGTVRLQAAAAIGDTQYQEGDSDELTLELGDNFSYTDGSENIDMTLKGTLEGITFDMDIDHALDMLYYIDVDASAAKGINKNNNVNFKAEKAGKVSTLGFSRK